MLGVSVIQYWDIADAVRPPIFRDVSEIDPCEHILLFRINEILEQIAFGFERRPFKQRPFNTPSAPYAIYQLQILL